MEHVLIKTLAVSASALALAGPAQGALVLTAAGTVGDHAYLSSGTSAWNTVPTSLDFRANFYWDADKDGVFGERGIGENTGNTSADLAFDAPVTSGEALHFGAEGFGGSAETGTIEFTLQLSDLSTLRLVVVEGTTESFMDSNGDQWEVDFDFDAFAYGDVVFNIGTGASGAGPQDHQGILTFTQVPEPGSLALLGLGGLLMARRRQS